MASKEAICYTKDDLGWIFREMRGEIVQGYSHKDMELLRCGENRLFRKKEMGWIECVVGRV